MGATSLMPSQASRSEATRAANEGADPLADLVCALEGAPEVEAQQLLARALHRASACDCVAVASYQADYSTLTLDAVAGDDALWTPDAETREAFFCSAGLTEYLSKGQAVDGEKASTELGGLLTACCRLGADAKMSDWLVLPVARCGHLLAVAVFSVAPDETESVAQRVAPLLSLAALSLSRHDGQETVLTRRHWLAETLRGMDNAVVATDAQGRIMHMNPTAQEMIGVKADQVEGRLIDDVITIVDHATGQPLDSVRLCALPGDSALPPIVDPHLQRPDTTTSPIQVRGAPILDDNGMPQGTMLVLRDLTAQREANRREMRYTRDLAFLSRSAMDLLQVGANEDLYDLVAEGILEWVGSAIVLVSAYAPERRLLITRAIAGLSHGTAERAAAPWRTPLVGAQTTPSRADRQALLTGELLSVTPQARVNEPRTLSAHDWDALCITYRIRTAYLIGITWKGSLLGSVTLLMHDNETIDNPETVETFVRQAALALQRRRSEEAFLEIHRHNEQVLAAIPSILIGLDGVGRIYEWNRAAETLLGPRRDEMIGRPLQRCQIPWDSERVWAAVAACRRQGQPDEIVDVRYSRPDGHEGLMHLALSPIPRVDGDESGVLILGSDMTARRVLETQLAQAQRLESIGRLAAGIAHEMNTPLQYVRDNLLFVQEAVHDLMGGLVGLIQDLRTSRDVAHRELLDTIEAYEHEIDLPYLRTEMPEAITQALEGVTRTAGIVGAMREFSQPASETRIVNLGRAIESTVAVARHEYRYVADMRLDLMDDLLVSCVPGEINQALLNIVVNAAHAIAERVGESGGKGRITISARRAGDWAEVRVHDTGIGIAPEIGDKVFEPFFTTKEVGKGMGQGLAMARRVIAEQHGGEIGFESQVGVGTTFWVRLPLARNQQAPTDSEPASTMKEA